MRRQGTGSYTGDAASFEIVGVIADERLTPFDDRQNHAVIYASATSRIHITRVGSSFAPRSMRAISNQHSEWRWQPSTKGLR